MLKATVTGAVWATRRLKEIPGGAFLEVLSDDGARLIAFDVLGTGVGERVLVSTGSVASGWFGPEHPPLDALIIGSLDEPSGAPAAATVTTTKAPSAGGASSGRTRSRRTDKSKEK